MGPNLGPKEGLPKGTFASCCRLLQPLLWIIITHSTTAEVLCSNLKILFSRYGLPIAVIADNGLAMIEKDLKAFLENRNIEYHHSTPLWPQANGLPERQNRSLLKRMRIAQTTKKNWKRNRWYTSLHTEQLLTRRQEFHQQSWKDTDVWK